jgi:DnaA N-terminal domain
MPASSVDDAGPAARLLLGGALVSRTAIAAALARDDLGTGERLVAFSLASFADRDARTLAGTPAAAGRAGLKRSWFLEARELLERRGLVVVERAGIGRGRASTLWLPFAETGPWWDGDINAELFETALSYTRARGAARLLLAAVGALADDQRVLEGVTTRQLCAAASLSDTTYRRARSALLASGELVLVSGRGGRGRSNCWEIADPRACAGEAAPVGRRRVAPPAGQRPLVASVSSTAATAAREHAGSENGEVDSRGDDRVVRAVKGGGDRTLSHQNRPVGGGVSPRNGAADRTLSGENRPAGGGVVVAKGAAGRTLSAETPPETPPKTPPPNARAGKGPQNPRTHPPSPPEGGGADSVVIEETFVSERGRKRTRPVTVDLAKVRSQLRAAGTEDRAAWEQIRGLLLAAVGESTFGMWLDPLQLAAVDPNGTLVLAVPEPIGGWVRTRFASVLVSAADRAGRVVRFATEVEHRAFAPPPPAAGTPRRPAAPAGLPVPQSRTECVSPAGGGSVSPQTDGSSHGRAYTSSYTDVYTQTREVS